MSVTTAQSAPRRRTTSTPAAVATTGSERMVRDALNQSAMKGWSTRGADPEFMGRIRSVLDFFLDRYFRVETRGWERLPDGPCLLIGVHSGTWLTMDAWSLVFDWQRRFADDRILHGTAHDVLMSMPVIGPFFRKVGVLPAKRETVTAALAQGHSVVVWPGGEVDALRTWKQRNEVLFAGRRGFVKQAILSGVPIVPVATVGGPDTVFVLSEGKRLAKLLRFDKYLRSDRLPIVAGLPFGIWPEVVPSHIPLPSKIVNEFLQPIHLRKGAKAAADDAYVDQVYAQVQQAVQAGVQRLASQRRFPVLG